MTDVDGVERLDAVNNFTALIHGHAFPPVVEAVTRQLSRGTAFSGSTPAEVALAELLVARVPRLERIRFGNSRTEAVMMAIKAARAYIGRDRIAKFEGAYHGYYDDVQVSFNSRPSDWGPDDAPASVPSSGGVPKHRIQETLVLPWNDREATERLVTGHRNELAAVLVDPLSNRMGFIPPAEGFLAFLRALTRAHGILLIYDEVISFRVGMTGASGRYGGDPDLFAFGKIIGGGFPVGATGGTAEVMEVFDPGTRGARIASEERTDPRIWHSTTTRGRSPGAPPELLTPSPSRREGEGRGEGGRLHSPPTSPSSSCLRKASSTRAVSSLRLNGLTM